MNPVDAITYAVQVAYQAVSDHPSLEAQVQAQRARLTANGYAMLEKSFNAYTAATQSLLARISSWLSEATSLRAALDTLGLSQDTTTSQLNGFGGTPSEMLLAAITPARAGDDLGFWQVLVEALTSSTARVVALRGFQLLMKAIPWVGGWVVSDNVAKIVSGDAAVAEAKRDAFLACLKASKEAQTPEQAEVILAKCNPEVSTGGTGTFGLLLLGAAAAGGAYLWFNRRRFTA